MATTSSTDSPAPSVAASSAEPLPGPAHDADWNEDYDRPEYQRQQAAKQGWIPWLTGASMSGATLAGPDWSHWLKQLGPIFSAWVIEPWWTMQAETTDRIEITVSLRSGGEHGLTLMDETFDIDGVPTACVRVAHLSDNSRALGTVMRDDLITHCNGQPVPQIDGRAHGLDEFLEGAADGRTNRPLAAVPAQGVGSEGIALEERSVSELGDLETNVTASLTVRRLRGRKLELRRPPYFPGASTKMGIAVGCTGDREKTVWGGTAVYVAELVDGGTGWCSGALFAGCQIHAVEDVEVMDANHAAKLLNKCEPGEATNMYVGYFPDRVRGGVLRFENVFDI